MSYAQAAAAPAMKQPSAITPAQFEALRVRAGLSPADLARALRLSPASGFNTVMKMREGACPISGPVAIALEALASGWRPSEIA